ncbi:DNA polymerase IV [Arhodomonas aquaeolei]|uniref:DNA polymerase IV n=1 Tax=Arhodomonas aquaeolei TaxID=2369 RepID=UPI00216710C8|nr:DNA polymerase IV [Arhodomonas aquaeolei]MCS4503429.1 DNA polymerase IV [Arhodomonas aquaeolei]
MTAPNRTIMHVDMDAFFASVELLRRPELAGQPVVVGGRGEPNRRGVVSTATYEARQYGIHSAMPLRRALELCPHAVFLPVDLAAYRAASTEVFALLRELSEHIEPVGLDEAYLDVSHRPEPPRTLGAELKARIHSRTRLTGSVGLAPNRLLAKIASDLEKPDGLTELTLDDVPDRVWPLPVRTLHGVGPRTEERLADLGIETIGDLAATPVERLATAFPANHAQALSERAHGHDERPVAPRRQRKSIGRETTFQKDCRSSARLAWLAEEMLTGLVPRLTERGLRARTVTVKIRYRDFVTQTRSLSLNEASADPDTLAAAVQECLRQHTLHRAVRLLGVSLSQLTDTPEGPQQLSIIQ